MVCHSLSFFSWLLFTLLLCPVVVDDDDDDHNDDEEEYTNLCLISLLSAAFYSYIHHFPSPFSFLPYLTIHSHHHDFKGMRQNTPSEIWLSVVQVSMLWR
jgi:hypothetical protein